VCKPGLPLNIGPCMVAFSHDFDIRKQDKELISRSKLILLARPNDTLYEIAKRYPNGIMGYTALAPCNPKAALDELQRAVTELGFKE